VADIDALITLRRALWPDDDSSPDELAALLQRDDFAGFIASIGGAPVGFAEITLRRYIDGAPDAANGFLEGLFVAEGHRRQGVADALLVAASARARANGATHLGSNADLDNDISQAWHRAMGFDEAGRMINFAKPL